MARAISSIEMIRKLVAFDTTSRESNLALIDFVRSYLDDHRIKSELVFDAARRKANLYATVGPDDRGGILLSGHSDVVPVDGQKWQSEPFAVAERDGTALWPRHRGHEELHRRDAGDGAGIHRRERARADPSGPHI